MSTECSSSKSEKAEGQRARGKVDVRKLGNSGASGGSLRLGAYIVTAPACCRACELAGSMPCVVPWALSCVVPQAGT